MTDPTFAASALAFAETQADEARAALGRLQAKDPKSEKVAEAKRIVKDAEDAVKAAQRDLDEATAAATPTLTGASGGTAHDATIVTT